MPNIDMIVKNDDKNKKKMEHLAAKAVILAKVSYKACRHLFEKLAVDHGFERSS